ncbi:hypothetical protein [Salidesulfovibrio onnuriiensis]|uniref:hypothetical protein n=1 Tax=Salidesulfovibrio onnuriiensis TaxID=2583823 RepID=UPI0032B72095
MPLLLTSLALALGLGLASVWLNIERHDLAYDLSNLEEQRDRKSALLVKLEVERDNLASPYRLRKLAEKYGLAVATPGQIRNVDEH